MGQRDFMDLTHYRRNLRVRDVYASLLRFRRIGAGLSIEDVSAATGIRANYISMIEKCQRRPRAALARIETFLNEAERRQEIAS